MINGKKEPKMRFLVFISGLVGIMPSLVVCQHHSVVVLLAVVCYDILKECIHIWSCMYKWFSDGNGNGNGCYCNVGS